ncbi:hypothetical protein LIER_22028 [Lithospermum erythrorhizon]|uniref:Uncharacterized protein n=1 Tax=Lithospermum erythrorhizon TaxID=34254 RepID=A0AAV3QSC4_LITER
MPYSPPVISFFLKFPRNSLTLGILAVFMVILTLIIGRTPDTVLASIWNHFLITPFTFVKTSTKSFLITKNIPLPLTPSQAPYIYSISSLPWELKIFLILVTFSLGRVQEEIERYMKNCIEQWETSRGLTLSPPLRVVASLFKYLITALYSLLPNFFQILSSHTQA